MRVLVLTHTYPRFAQDTNGPFVKDLSEALARLGPRLRVLTAHDNRFRFDPSFHRVPVRTYRYVWPDAAHLLGYSRTIKADTNLKWWLMPLVPGMVLSAFHSVLREVESFSPDIVHAHWLVPSGFIAGVVSRFKGTRTVVTLHGSGAYLAGRYGMLARVISTGLKGVSRVVSCSPDLAAVVERLGFPPDRISLVPNGVDVEAFSIAFTQREKVSWLKKWGIPEGSPVILALGRFAYKKGFHHLVKAAARLKDKIDFRLVLAGGGDLEGELRRLVAQVGLAERTVFPGVVYRPDIPRWLACADIFCVPSVRDPKGNVDGLPVVLLEAMAAAKAIVASRISGIPLAVGDNEAVMVEPGDEMGLAGALELLLGDPGLRKELGERARRRARRELDWESVARRYLEIYHQVLAG